MGVSSKREGTANCADTGDESSPPRGVKGQAGGFAKRDGEQTFGCSRKGQTRRFVKLFLFNPVLDN